jgi:hypothetical protein
VPEPSLHDLNNLSWGERKTTFVYLIGRPEGPVKVGITTNLLSRLRSLQTGAPFPLELLYVATFQSADKARLIEADFCKVCSEQRLEGEWFDMDFSQAAEGLDTGIEWSTHTSEALWQLQKNRPGKFPSPGRSVWR